ncbi:GET4 family protein [Megaselia abdita]
MERSNGGRGVARVLGKLENSIQEGNFYEAHQMYRTLFFRYSGQNKVDDCLSLLHSGAKLFLEKEQYSSGADLILLLLTTLGKRSKPEKEEIDEWVEKLGNLIGKMKPTVVERQDIITKSIQWAFEVSKSYATPLLHKKIGQILWTEGSFLQARKHILLSKEGVTSGRMLVAFSTASGYKTEIDLIITQFILQQLCALKEPEVSEITFKTYTLNHPDIKKSAPPFNLALLNFLWFLIELVKQQAVREAVFKKIVELYKPSLDRDPEFKVYLEKIGRIYFNIQEPAQNRNGPLSGLFGEVFNSFMRGLNEGDDDIFGESGDEESTVTIMANNGSEVD